LVFSLRTLGLLWFCFCNNIDVYYIHIYNDFLDLSYHFPF
jgi:hypothetical protein